jgi:hypothetical protein
VSGYPSSLDRDAAIRAAIPGRPDLDSARCDRIVPEVGTEHAVELLSQPITWMAPRLMVAKVAAALRWNVWSTTCAPSRR